MGLSVLWADGLGLLCQLGPSCATHCHHTAITPFLAPAGGETRLVSLPFHSHYQGLLEALERTCAPLGGGPGGSSDSASDAAPRTLVSACIWVGGWAPGGSVLAALAPGKPP